MFERIDGAPEYLIRKTINDRDHVDRVVRVIALGAASAQGSAALQLFNVCSCRIGGTDARA